MRIAILSTSHGQLGDTGIASGLGLETLASPYYRFLDAGVEVVLASILGGCPPIDPLSLENEVVTPETDRFLGDADAQKAFATTVAVEDLSTLDGLFIAGGHGGMWDFPVCRALSNLIADMLTSDQPVAAICHAPAALCGLTDDQMKGRRVTGLSNSEERALGREKLVPFLLETELARKGAIYNAQQDFTSHVVVDGALITGQNMRSAQEAASALLKYLDA